MPNPMISVPITTRMNAQIAAEQPWPGNLNGNAAEYQPFVAAFDVGQGNCVALFDNGGQICAYVDYGLPGPGNQDTLETYDQLNDDNVPCVCSDPVMILTHWDLDHLGMVEKNRRARTLRWIVPQQELGSRTAKQFYARLLVQILMQRRADIANHPIPVAQRAGLYLWPLGPNGAVVPHRLWTPWGFLERGTGGTGRDLDTNDNGIIASVCVAGYHGDASAWNPDLNGRNRDRPTSEVHDYLPELVDEAARRKLGWATRNNATQTILEFARRHYYDQLIKDLADWVRRQHYPTMAPRLVTEKVWDNLVYWTDALRLQEPESHLQQHVTGLLDQIEDLRILLNVLGEDELVQLAGDDLTVDNIQNHPVVLGTPADQDNGQRFILLPGDNSLFEMPSLKTANPPRYVGLVAVHHGADSWLKDTYDRTAGMVREVFTDGRRYLMNDGRNVRDLIMTPAPPAPGFRRWPWQAPYFAAPARDPLANAGVIGGGRIVYSSGVKPNLDRPYGHPNDGAVLSYLQRGWSSRLDTAERDWRGAGFYYPDWQGGPVPDGPPNPHRAGNVALGWQPDGVHPGTGMTYLWRDVVAFRPQDGGDGDWQVALRGVGGPLVRRCPADLHGEYSFRY